MNHPLRATLGRTRRIPLAGLGRRTPGNYHPPYSTLPPKGPSTAAAVGAAGLLVAVPLTAYLVYRSQVRQVYPDPIQQLLRQALTAEHRVDHRKAEIAFRQAYEQAKQLVPSGTLDWFKASAIALRWADALERTARLSQAVQVYELVLDDLRRALPSLTVPERVRTIQIAQKLAQLYPSLPLTASRTERTTEAAVDKKVEDWLTFCVHEILKIQRDTSNSPSTPSLYLQETIDSPDQLLLALPAWLETVQFASCFEALGKFYARRGQIDLALPLYLQTLSLLLPPPAAGTTARAASDDERCQAATVMNNIGQLLFARSETEAPAGAEQLRANAATWLAQAAGLARRVLTDHHQPLPPVDSQLPTASSSSVSASEVAALAECRQAFRAASANLALIGGSHPPASPSSHSPAAHHAPLSDLTSSPQRPSP